MQPEGGHTVVARGARASWPLPEPSRKAWTEPFGGLVHGRAPTLRRSLHLSLTSRNPNDLKEFSQAIEQYLKKNVLNCKLREKMDE